METAERKDIGLKEEKMKNFKFLVIAALFLGVCSCFSIVYGLATK